MIQIRMIPVRWVVIIASFLGVLSGKAQSFFKVTGDPARAEAGHVAHRAPGGELFIAGSVNDSALVQRIDATGNILWSRTFKPPGQFPKCVFHLSSTPDNALIGCGNGFNATGGPQEGFHFRMAVDGTMQWVRYWEDPLMYSRRIIALSATEYLLFADDFDLGSPTNADVVTARVDAATGDITWLSDRLDLYSTVPFTDDVIGVATIGQSHYATSAIFTAGAPFSGKRVALSKFDFGGQHLETNYLLYPDNVDRRLYPSDIIANDDSLTIAYFGDINGSSTNWTQGLIRLDTTGAVAWARDFNVGGSGQEHGSKIIATSFGYVIAGRTNLTSPKRLFLMAISKSGSLIWTKSYGDPSQEQSLVDFYATNLVDMGDGYLMTGLVDNGAGDTDIMIVRTDAEGDVICTQVTPVGALTTVLPDLTFPSPVQEVPFASTLGGAPTDVLDVNIFDLCNFSVDLGNDTALCGDLVLDAGVPGSQYEWQDGSTGQLFTVTESGTYWVRVIQNCCIATDTIEVDVDGLALIDLGADTTLCGGAELTLEAPSGTWTILWSDGTDGEEIVVSTADTYWVRLTDGNCTATDTVVVSTADLPTVDLGADTVSCDGEGVLLEPDVTDGEDYLWSDQSTGTTLLVVSTGTITLEVTNACGVASDAVEVSIVEPIELDLGADTTICDGTTLSLEVDLADWTLTWSDGTTGNTFDIDVEGTYWLDAVNTGCTVTDTIVVDVIGIPVVDLGADTIVCNGGPLLLSPELVDVDEVLWSDGSSADQLLVSTSGVWSITATNVCGSGTDDIEVTFISPDALDLGNDTLLCGTDSLTLDLSGSGASLTWQDGSEEDTFLVTGPGTYWVEGDLEGCTLRDTIDVQYTQLPSLDLGPDTLSCEVPLYILDAGDDGEDAEWSDGSEGRFLVTSNSGLYWASITNYCGQVIDSVRVTFAMAVSELEDVALCPGTKVELRPEGELLETIWSTGDTAAAITVGEGEYSYEAVDIVGCPHTDLVRVFIDQGLDGQVYIPNAFSPNDDGFNELFLVEGPERSDFELAIHDRWGEELYRSIDPYQGWDGESGSQPGVYVYTVTYRDRCAANNTLVTKRGHVTLLR
ncbi:MAG: gliding motility-associated C-terminal domain-containing protein [Flavobacteriales bacterium]|nr:gliding motility-associated C-terminal domain-containing protein [Flavobacteriales bacterium]